MDYNDIAKTLEILKDVVNALENADKGNFDKAILGSLKNKLEPILKLKPDVIVLGPDQTTFDEETLKKNLPNIIYIPK